MTAPTMNKYAAARLSLVGANMVNRSVALLVSTAHKEVARALISVQATMTGTVAGNKAIQHYASAIRHLLAARSDVDVAKEEVKKALHQIHLL